MDQPMPSPQHRPADSTDSSGGAVHSVLFVPGEHPEAGTPAYFPDLNLDQVAAALLSGGHALHLETFFTSVLSGVEAVHYRQEVVRDLAKDEVLGLVRRFVEAMRRMREHNTRVDQSRHRLQKHALFLKSVEFYCDAVIALADDIGRVSVESRGLRGLQEAVRAYVASGEFTDLHTDASALRESFSHVRYSIRVRGAHVSVSKYADQPDYGEEVRSIFARFQQQEVPVHAEERSSSAQLGFVEGGILDGVEGLYPDLFAKRATFYARRDEFLDATLGRFDREVQFYLAWFDLIRPLRVAGLPFCLPVVSEESHETSVEGTFDLALALQLVAEGGQVVENDIRLEGAERLLIVTGPNSGGKTTYARMFGQLHHLAALGLPVPGRRARLLVPDQIFTHFQREEELATLRSKFEDELVRAREFLQEATSRSVIVLNESFGSTSLSDAIHVATSVVSSILELDCIGVYVTFIDEIASLGEGTVSMVSQISPEDPAKRTFVLHRAVADGRAHAWAIADKHGLSHERLMKRLTS